MPCWLDWSQTPELKWSACLSFPKFWDYRHKLQCRAWFSPLFYQCGELHWFLKNIKPILPYWDKPYFVMMHYPFYKTMDFINFKKTFSFLFYFSIFWALLPPPISCSTAVYLLMLLFKGIWFFLKKPIILYIIRYKIK